MKLYIKQKVFSWGDKFTVKDEEGTDRYFVEGEIFSWGRKLHVYDMNGQEAAFIQQELFTLLPRYHVFCNGQEIAEIKKEFSFFLPKYSIEKLGWEVEGKFSAHDYRILKGRNPIAIITKEWMTWGDSYKINIVNPEDEIMSLAVVLTIDCVTASQGGVSVSVSSS